MGKKQLSGAQKRKKKKEREEAAKDTERLKLGPTKLWTGLVLHHKDVFVSHVISKLNGTDRFFFSEVNTESWDVLKYAGVNVSELGVNVYECSSISTLEWAWNHLAWGEKDEEGNVIDQAWFCKGVAGTNKLELLKWAREVKQCEWDARTINRAAEHGNLEMVKYCVANECPIGTGACANAAENGHLACLKYLHEEVKSALGLLERIPRSQEQPNRMCTIPPRQQLPITTRLAIRTWSTTRATRVVVVIIIIIIIIVDKQTRKKLVY